MELFEDVDELRARLLKETEEALRLADALAAATAVRPATPEAAALAAEYLQTRALTHRLRNALRVLVAG